MDNPKFLEFKPINSHFISDVYSPENIAEYYSQTNIPIDNKYLQSYITTPIAPVAPVVATPKSSNRAVLTDIINNRILPKQIQSTSSRIPFNLTSKTPAMSKKTTALSKKAQDIINEIKGLNIGEEDKDYLIKLGKRESSYNSNIVNQYGYEGLYQFGDAALDTVGMNRTDLRASTINQHKAALKLAEVNEKIVGDVANKYIGKTYRGVKITRNGIRAASHLLGAGTVKDWFQGTTNTKYAKRGFVDGNGTSITEYFKLFV